MAKQSHKEQLFESSFYATRFTFESLEEHFLLDVMVQAFGGVDLTFEEQKAKDHFRGSNAWKELSELYEYAINGVVASEYDVHYADRSYIVTNGAAIIEVLSSGEGRLSPEWKEIYAMGDGRFCLDGGENISLMKLALLARVDLRTVRNAVSAGQIATCKEEKMFEQDTVFAENASARRWLLGRKGFKPTLRTNLEREQICDINSPSGFGSFLAQQRKEVEEILDADDIVKRSVNHSSVNQEAINQLESGVFTLPLDAVFPIADFYQVSRKEMLECVMRVFFSEELSMLASDVAQAGAQ